jgi:hypothetical protein
MNDKNNKEIMRAIGTLEGTVKMGFKGIHERQDTANNRTEKVEDRLLLVETETDKQQTDLKWLKKNYWIIVTASLGTFFSVLGIVLLSLFKML